MPRELTTPLFFLLPGNLHLTSASSLIHLRPQPHHIDAASEQERNARGINTGGAGAAPTKEAARAIHMTIKQSKDGDDELVQETMADRLKKVQTETWRKMRYVHDESSDAWAMSEEVLYLDDAKGKDAQGAGGHAVAELADKVAALSTGWREVSMLETTSGIQNPEAGIKVEISDDETPGAAAAAAAAAATASKAKARGKAKATASSSATTTTRGKRSTTTTNSTAKAGPSTRAKKSKS